MKTKVICIMLLTCLFFLKASLHVCICPQASQEIKGDPASICMQMEKDVCADCGHTKSCCLEQQNVELASGDASFAEEQCYLATVPATISIVLEFPSTAPAEDRFENKAPPLQTPISLHQKLLV
jgi:hypothetical protein